MENYDCATTETVSKVRVEIALKNIPEKKRHWPDMCRFKYADVKASSGSEYSQTAEEQTLNVPQSHERILDRRKTRNLT